MSDEEFEALTQDDLDRKQARKQSAVERQKGIVKPTEPRRFVTEDGDADPSYQTAPLEDYRASLRAQSAALFDEIKKSVDHRAVLRDGSYSVESKRHVIAAKIVMYQRGLASAKESGAFPALQDGIYVLVRTEGRAGTAIWNSGIVQDLGFAQRLNRDATVGIAPNHKKRFAYFEVTDGEDRNLIAELLVKCSNLC